MPATPRRTRSDALQNRERLLEVAAQAFAEQGLDTSPAAIAKQAGVGVGTLYRHFPTREVLIDAAYRRQLTQVCEKANDLLTQYPAAEATRMWMEHFIHYATAKSGMSEASTLSSPPASIRTRTAARSLPTLLPPSSRPRPRRKPATGCRPGRCPTPHGWHRLCRAARNQRASPCAHRPLHGRADQGLDRELKPSSRTGTPTRAQPRSIQLVT